MINISKLAQNHFLNLLSKQKKNTHIRAFVSYPGTPIAKCGVSFCYPEEITKHDVKFRYDKFQLYIDKISMPYLKDSVIDIVTENFQSQLTLLAPYAKRCIIKNDSALEERVKFFLDSKINPQLLSHGGRVHLINITQSGYVVIKFSGGCNGCSMVGRTLKDGIERQLLVEFSEFQGVYDVTEHHKGEHSYY
ncbi:Fe/S biogenesis protein NfuA [Buchnera aphidicola (Schlechtendalia chinensis)]|uniref:Fe/S biogenesis protein NfuA n=1 Tax=Buchnera aphidicola subsp. Schlechtendalia chinensis TaxID=118110 RepID=A0A172WE54_BUCSC|nr:NfuA family Fe-S biogenesis protein [Buchnera aphidicola]ANF17241.1 Fe/S biogenesis protein NfuA [Buchnera aphidicola (Schlechtendalia chinensis)]